MDSTRFSRNQSVKMSLLIICVTRSLSFLKKVVIVDWYLVMALLIQERHSPFLVQPNSLAFYWLLSKSFKSNSRTKLLKWLLVNFIRISFIRWKTKGKNLFLKSLEALLAFKIVRLISLMRKIWNHYLKAIKIIDLALRLFKMLLALDHMLFLRLAPQSLRLELWI